MKDIVLFGAGGLARETIMTVESLKEFRLLGFVVDEQYYHEGQMVGGYPVLGSGDWLVAHKDDVFCNVAIGFPKARAAIQEKFSGLGVRFATLVHPNARVRDRSVLGEGCLVQINTAVSVDCKLGKGVFLNGGSITIGHDAIIGDYTCIMPGTGISGGCVIGREVMIGGHAYVIPRKRVGDRATIAAGSVVFTNVRAGTTVLGNPAKRIPCLED
ncbi:MAG: acetyltransferase [Synergistaceae bacterium]|nr:acetyltransferase [Synergistaceae bacterium]